MDGIPSFAQASAGGNLTQDIANLAPTATVYHGAQTGVSIAQVKSSPAGSQGVMPAFIGKLESIGKEGAHIAMSADRYLINQGKSMVQAPPKFGTALGNLGLDAYTTHSLAAAQTELGQRLGTISDQYKSGRISLAQYKVALKEYNQDANNLISEESANQTHLSHDGKVGAQTGINTASTIVTILSGGLSAGIKVGGESVAADFLGSAAADESMNAGEQAIGKLALNKTAFDSLSPAVKNAVQSSTSDIMANGSANMTSKQIARTMAVNLALKYPIAYAALAGTGQQVYDELQQDKYGDAAKTLAFNAALLLSGGPIGVALKKGGEAGATLKTGLFGNSSFLDQLSQLMGDKNPSGLFNAIKDDPELVKNFSALESTNVTAEGGNITNAVYRIIDGLQNAGWGNVPTMSHEEFATQVNDWANAQRMVTEDAISRGIPADKAANFVVGRWTTADANNAALQVSNGSTSEDWLQNWEDLKYSNPNAAWANNENLDKEITTKINEANSSTQLEQSIRGIEASAGIKGVSSGVASKLSKMGYVAIQPKDLEAPFKEGGQISSRFAENNDFFLKTTSPLPVLGSVGSLLVKAGLSPESSQQQMYQIFTSNLSRNLEEAGVTGRMAGETADQSADTISKKLADYARNLPKSLKNPPITDYRQMSTSEIAKALDLSRTEAQKVGDALMDSMLQVPLSVRGLGDRVVDLNYKLNPLSGRYARLQGALRFAWNPFFKAKLSYKAEFLTQFESGGKFPTLAGTNKILSMVFPEKYAQLDEISNSLEKHGIFGAGYTDEAASAEQEGQKSLGHVVLPSQKRSVAGLVSTMADKAGMNTEDFITNFPDQTRDTVRMILQYDPRNSLLNSPLVRTINFAFFPARFNLKVATIVAKSLGRTDALTQFAVVKGMMQGSQFLKSPEGQSWYSQNSDVIGLMKYFSPVATLSEISQALGQKPTSISQYGELGGLPFGWIPALLNAEGLIDTNQAYVDPKTGSIAQDYVPVGMRGKANAAIQDLIGQLFTYPGATVGLPSKTKIDLNIAGGLVPGSSKDFNKVTPQISPAQQSFQQVVQQNAGTAKQASLTGVPQSTPSSTVPSQSTPITTPNIKPSSSSTPKKKKADFTPSLLPGQTQLGQL